MARAGTLPGAVVRRPQRSRAAAFGRAMWLFGRRGWQVRGSDIPEPQKWFPIERIRVRFSFPDARHYLASNEVVMADRVTFTKEYRPLPLAQVPPLVFSEVLRDADLVVSAAAVVATSEIRYSPRASTSCGVSPRPVVA